MSRTNNIDKTYKRLSNWFITMFSVFILFETFMLGFSLGLRDWKGVASNGILLLLWIGSLCILIASRVSSTKDDLELTKLEAKLEALEEMNDSLEKIKKAHMLDQENDELGETLIAISHDITKEHRAPTEDELPLIEAAFHENTGLFIRLSLSDHGDHNGMNADISEKPFPPRETKPDTPKKKGKGKNLDGIKTTTTTTTKG